ncbi:MAG: hypothetical protein KAX80_02090 [Planctomycetes bacterium]|nr:hypothetical protein [Planctomycetota bacterium]
MKRPGTSVVVLVAAATIGVVVAVAITGLKSSSQGGAPDVSRRRLPGADGGAPWHDRREARNSAAETWGPKPAFRTVEEPLPHATLALDYGKHLLLVSLPSLEAKPLVTLERRTLLTPYVRPGSDWGLVAAWDDSAESSLLLKWELKSGKTEELFALPLPFAYPSESPDGSSVALLQGANLYTKGVVLNCKLLLARPGASQFGPVQEAVSDVAQGYVQWLPDSKSFLFTASDGGLCRLDVGSSGVTRYAVKGMAGLLPGGRAVVLLEGGKELRVLSFPDLTVRQEVRLVYPGFRESQPIVIDEETIAYVAPRPWGPMRGFGIVIVRLGEPSYQADILSVPTGLTGFAVLPQSGADRE